MNTTLAYNCPNCSAGLLFDAEKQCFHCEFCLSDFTADELKDLHSEEKEAEAVRNNEEFCSHMNEYECPNCGAQIAADENTAADYCYFCHNPVILKGRLSGQIKPDKIIPFKLDKDAAISEFMAYVSKRWFVPRDFFSKKQIEKIKGVYYPFWVTDADTCSSINGTAKRIRHWVSGDYKYTETSVYSIYRSGNIHFEDIVTSALAEVEKKEDSTAGSDDKAMLEGILPYPLEAHADFDMPYLLGFTAKKRNLERDDVTEEVKNKIGMHAEQVLRNTVSGYSSFDVVSRNVNIHTAKWEYTLMPIWILTYKARNGKTYIYAMNGYTGKIYGTLPLSFIKLALLFLGVAVGAALISFFVASLLFS